MKKAILCFLILVLLPATVFARVVARTNMFASWLSVANAGGEETIRFPSDSRDITIINGDGTNAVAVNLDGNSVSNCAEGALDDCFQLPADTQITLQDYITRAVTFGSVAGTSASPVSVIITF